MAGDALLFSSCDFALVPDSGISFLSGNTQMLPAVLIDQFFQPFKNLQVRICHPDLGRSLLFPRSLNAQFNLSPLLHSAAEDTYKVVKKIRMLFHKFLALI